MKGCIIALEGPEGGGKTTQATLLTKNLNDRGFAAEYIREPGGTRVGEQVRNVLLDVDNDGMDPWAEALLYAASRAELVDKVLLPKLNEGKVLVLDRYYDSSIAYQGGGRELPLDFIRSINEKARQVAPPLHTFILDISPEVGLGRKNAQDEVNRMELQQMDFHTRVRETFLSIAKGDGYTILDATRPAEELSAEILKETLKRLSK